MTKKVGQYIIRIEKRLSEDELKEREKRDQELYGPGNFDRVINRGMNRIREEVVDELVKEPLGPDEVIEVLKLIVRMRRPL